MQGILNDEVILSSPNMIGPRASMRSPCSQIGSLYGWSFNHGFFCKEKSTKCSWLPFPVWWKIQLSVSVLVKLATWEAKPNSHKKIWGFSFSHTRSLHKNISTVHWPSLLINFNANNPVESVGHYWVLKTLSCQKVD